MFWLIYVHVISCTQKPLCMHVLCTLVTVHAICWALILDFIPLFDGFKSYQVRSIVVSVYNWNIQLFPSCIILMLLMLILFNCETVVEVFGKIFFIWSYTNQQISIVAICWSVYIFDSLYTLFASACGPLKFRILIALCCSFLMFSTA